MYGLEILKYKVDYKIFTVRIHEPLFILPINFNPFNMLTIL